MGEGLKWFGETVDRLVTLPLAKTRSKLEEARVIASYYEAARDKLGGPLTLLAAQKLKETVHAGDNVILITNSHETDGPVGIAGLARAIEVGLKATPIIVSCVKETLLMPGPYCLPSNVLPRVCTAAGLMPVLFQDIDNRYHRVAIQEEPSHSNAEEALEASKRILSEINPKVVISSEEMGRNRKGVYHSAWGYAWRFSPDPESKLSFPRLDHLLELAQSRGIPAVSVGDNGNEMGFGSIEEAVRRHHPFGQKCQCPCGDGIATVVKADIVIPAATSNLGCNGIEACLAEILNEVDVMHDGETERRMLFACSNSGCPDGSTTFTTPTCDGTPFWTSIYIIELLRMTISQSLKTSVRLW